MTDPLYRYWGRVNPEGRTKPPILAEAPETKQTGDVAVMRLYDVVDSWGSYWGVSAKEFADALDQVPSNVSEIRLHINSPGGDVFDGTAIANLIRNHSARVVGVVDGLAASIASVIAVACDELQMGANTSLMVHDAWSVAIGNAADMREMAGVLDHVSANLADAYATKAGGTRADWRAVMQDETWFDAAEAVAAGLADRLTTDAPAAAARASFDLSAFRYGGRAQAPAPVAAGAGTQPKGSSMSKPKPPAQGGPVRGGVPAHDSEVVARTWDPGKVTDGLHTDLRPSQLRSCYAWVDADGDPELAESYAYLHHHGVDGPANLRACVAGIARLNGAAGGPGVPDGDRPGVYDHLAAHVRDAGRTPAPLNDSIGERPDGQLADELVWVLTEVSAGRESASRVVALRADKGKSLSKSNAELLDWIRDEITAYDALCAIPTTPDGPSRDEMQKLALASAARSNALRGETL